MGHARWNSASFSAVLRRLWEPIRGQLGGMLGDNLRWALTNRNTHFQHEQGADNRVLRECELCRRDYRAEGSRLCAVCGDAIARLARLAASQAKPTCIGTGAEPGNSMRARDLLAARRARALGVGLASGGYGQDELERAGAYRTYEDPLDFLNHLDEVGVRFVKSNSVDLSLKTRWSGRRRHF